MLSGAGLRVLRLSMWQMAFSMQMGPWWTFQWRGSEEAAKRCLACGSDPDWENATSVALIALGRSSRSEVGVSFMLTKFCTLFSTINAGNYFLFLSRRHFKMGMSLRVSFMSTEIPFGAVVCNIWNPASVSSYWLSHHFALLNSLLFITQIMEYI